MLPTLVLHGPARGSVRVILLGGLKISLKYILDGDSYGIHFHAQAT